MSFLIMIPPQLMPLDALWRRISGKEMRPFTTWIFPQFAGLGSPVWPGRTLWIQSGVYAEWTLSLCAWATCIISESEHTYVVVVSGRIWGNKRVPLCLLSDPACFPWILMAVWSTTAAVKATRSPGASPNWRRREKCSMSTSLTNTGDSAGCLPAQVNID